MIYVYENSFVMENVRKLEIVKEDTYGHVLVYVNGEPKVKVTEVDGVYVKTDRKTVKISLGFQGRIEAEYVRRVEVVKNRGESIVIVP